MKIIDLFNDMANGKPIPNKILLFGVTFEYNYKEATYLSHYDKFNLLNMNNHSFRNKSISLLNEEIEILEEGKKIPEKLSILQFSDLIDMSKEELIENIKEQRFKINEIIDYLESREDDKDVKD